MQFVGLPTVVDQNIPYIHIDFETFLDKKGKFKPYKNPDFIKDFNEYIESKGATKDSKIIIICRSGDRSAWSINDLAKFGYTNLWDVVDGFEGDMSKEPETKGKRVVNGWKNAGVPWSYKKEKEKMYIK